MVLSEELIYYAWSMKAFDHNQLFTTKGEAVEILSYGTRNFSSGPDFLNGKVKIDGVIWAGNIEMHVLSSDWKKHNHDSDNAYKNVILHVVYEDDKSPNDLPVLVMKDRINKNILDQFDALMESTTWVACQPIISNAKLDRFPIWANKLAVERIANKADKIKNSKAYREKDWAQLMYEYIARYFGATENSDSFESLATRLPYNIILKNKSDRFIIESLVFGVAGFFEKETDDEYFLKLKTEFLFQQKKYNLTPLKLVEWRNFGMYAAGSPTFRLAQFAAFIFNSNNIFDQCLDIKTADDLKRLLDGSLSEYWQNHYSFTKETTAIKSHTLSSDLKERVIMNAIVPVLFMYAKEIDDSALAEQAIDFLVSLKPENNSIITKWKSLGLKATNALESQALIELKNKYCDAKRCLSCAIGRELVGCG